MFTRLVQVLLRAARIKERLVAIPVVARVRELSNFDSLLPMVFASLFALLILRSNAATFHNSGPEYIVILKL